ncbi:sensor histidine kinase [Amycolatopsis cihanbeyliensis]|uniref:Signal transduction histidine kinase n=1 Tax=Amycolatopsis cihanbeyliensis TaxID=1128664 RepID=A0A542DEQ5_AMYCI|nr:sensor histidine kinase [Amycolatopsis cihanbeyliensis]TQJ01552.1 signal transduction histidine kinase [Amycolatopsis cihanbeyliensis]
MRTGPGRRPSAFWPSLLADDKVQPWHPWVLGAERAFPFLLLPVATLLALPSSPNDRSHQLGTLGLVLAAAVWVLLTDTIRPGHLRTSRWAELVSFAGFTALATVLMLRENLFLVFMVAGFFYAIRLRPVPVMFGGLALCSTLIHTIPAGGVVHALTKNPFLWLTIIAVQTLAIGGGSLMSDALTEQSEARRKAVADLEAALEENAGLHRQLLSQAREAGILDERQRLSREIHDTLAQGLTGIITQLQAAEQARADPAAWQRRLDTAAALARENLAEARRSVHALGPEPLVDARLPEALAAVVRRWSDRSGVPIEFTTTGAARPMHPEIEATLLRVTQEALTNVAKHAKAARVGLTLSYMEDQVTLDVRDDGRGFEVKAVRPNGHGGFGLSGMRQRVQRLAGSLEVESERDAGTAISASVPAIPAGSAEGADTWLSPC